MTILYHTTTVEGTAPPGGTGQTYVLSASAGSGTCVKNTVAGTVTPPNDTTRWTITAGGTLMTWLSAAFTSAVTVSGSVTVGVRAQESNVMANATYYARVGKLSGGVYTWIGNANLGTEFGTSAGDYSVIISPSSTNFSIGDKFVCEIHMDDSTGLTMGAGYTLTITLGATTYVSTVDDLFPSAGVKNSLMMQGCGI